METQFTYFLFYSYKFLCKQNMLSIVKIQENVINFY